MFVNVCFIFFRIIKNISNSVDYRIRLKHFKDILFLVLICIKLGKINETVGGRYSILETILAISPPTHSSEIDHKN